MLFAEPLRLEQPMLARLCLIEGRQCIATMGTLAGLESFAETLVLLQRLLPVAFVDTSAHLWRYTGEKLGARQAALINVLDHRFCPNAKPPSPDFAAASARRPASVIRTRATSIDLPPATTRSADAVASPAAIPDAEIRILPPQPASPSPTRHI